MPFDNGDLDLRTVESVAKDTRPPDPPLPLPQGDGDSRPLDQADEDVSSSRTSAKTS